VPASIESSKNARMSSIDSSFAPAAPAIASESPRTPANRVIVDRTSTLLLRRGALRVQRREAGRIEPQQDRPSSPLRCASDKQEVRNWTEGGVQRPVIGTGNSWRNCRLRFFCLEKVRSVEGNAPERVVLAQRRSSSARVGLSLRLISLSSSARDCAGTLVWTKPRRCVEQPSHRLPAVCWRSSAPGSERRSGVRRAR
jgi:hypothetical protein